MAYEIDLSAYVLMLEPVEHLKRHASSTTSPVQTLLQSLALIQALQQSHYKLIRLPMLLEIWRCLELHTNHPRYLLFSLEMFCRKVISMVKRV